MNCEHGSHFGPASPIFGGGCILCWKAKAEEWEKKAREIALAHGRTSVDWSNELIGRQKAESERDAAVREIRVSSERMAKAEAELLRSAGHTCKGSGCSCKYGQALAAKERSEAAAAEMRVILQSLHNDIESGEISPAGPFVALLEHALSSDVGKGWVSPAEASAMSVQHMNHVAIIGRLEAKLAIAVEALNRIWFAPCTCNEPVELCECAQRSAKEALSKLKEDKA